MIEHLPASGYQRQVWKNGLGVTEQICVSPTGASLASGFAYRVSRAQVTAGGPFSLFPGCDRILTVVEGDGLSLVRANETKALELFEPFRFSGDEAITAELARGAITDLNVIFDRGRADASCELTGGQRLEPGEHILYCLRGGFAVGAVMLDAGDSLRAFSAVEVVPRDRASLALHVRIRCYP